MEANSKTIPTFRFKYIETPKLRNTSVDELLFSSSMYSNSLKRGGMHTIGDVLDNWEDIAGAANKHGEENGINPSMGASRVLHIKASVFAYMCDMGLVNFAEVELRNE